MSFDVTDIVLAVIALISAVITSVIAPLVKKKTGAAEFDSAMKWIGVAVDAAEQIYDAGNGEEKKQFVYDFLAGKGLVMNEEEVDAAIEAQVLKLKQATKK